MGDSDEITTLKRKVALSCRILAMTGLVKETTGHVSARVPGTDQMLIRARGLEETGLLFTSAAEILQTDFNGSDIADDAPLGKPHELPIHGESYKARPQVGCVVHAHPPAILLCGIAGIELRPIFGAYDPSALKIALDGIPVYQRSITLTTPELGQAMLTCMGSQPVCLLKGHGITVHGRTVEDATVRAIKMETLARVNWEASQHGQVPEITEQDKDKYRRPSPKGERNAAPPVWRYYVSLLERRGLLPEDELL